MSLRRADLEVGMTRDSDKPASVFNRPADIAPWIKRKVASVLADIAAKDARHDRALAARVADIEKLFRLPVARGLSLDQRAARLADAAGIELPQHNQSHAQEEATHE